MDTQQQQELEQRYISSEPVMYPHNTPSLAGNYPKAGDEGLRLAHLEPSLTAKELSKRHEDIRKDMTSDMPKVDKARLELTMRVEMSSLHLRDKPTDNLTQRIYDRSFEKLVDFDTKHEHPVVTGVDMKDEYNQRMWMNREGREHPNENSPRAQQERTFKEEAGLNNAIMPEDLSATPTWEDNYAREQYGRFVDLQKATGLGDLNPARQQQAPEPKTEPQVEQKVDSLAQAPSPEGPSNEPPKLDFANLGARIEQRRDPDFAMLDKYRDNAMLQNDLRQHELNGGMSMKERVETFKGSYENAVLVSKGKEPRNPLSIDSRSPTHSPQQGMEQSIEKPAINRHRM
jgi:hypothetical protein